MKLGIDLGTTFSLVSTLGPKGEPLLLPDLHDASSFRTPSVVHLGESGALVGEAAEDLLRSEPDAAVSRHVKIRMGDDDVILSRPGGPTLCPVAVSALIVQKLARDAVAFQNEEISGCVVCVPAQFGDEARRATRDAVLAAGLPSPRLVEEPVAAAAFHGLNHVAGDQTLMVYDLGGGTFDVTLLQSGPEGLYVLSTEGDNSVGGISFDSAIAEWIVQDHRSVTGGDLRHDPGSREKVRRLAEKAKIALSRPGVRRFEEDMRLGGSVLHVDLTVQQLERLIADQVERTLGVSEKCLAGAGLSWGHVDHMLLVGGSTMVPLVQRCVRQRAGSVGERALVQQPLHAVAFGAAIIAHQTGAEAVGRSVVHGLVGHDLGIRVRDERTGTLRTQVLISRGSALPAHATSTFVTSRADQRRMVFELVQARSEGEVRSLGHFVFGPIASPRQGKPLELSVLHDEEGLVRARVRDPETNVQLEQLIGDRAQTNAMRVARVREALTGLSLGRS